MKFLLPKGACNTPSGKIFKWQARQCTRCVQEDMMMRGADSSSAGTSQADVRHLHMLLMNTL